MLHFTGVKNVNDFSSQFGDRPQGSKKYVDHYLAIVNEEKRRETFKASPQFSNKYLLVEIGSKLDEVNLIELKYLSLIFYFIFFFLVFYHLLQALDRATTAFAKYATSSRSFRFVFVCRQGTHADCYPQPNTYANDRSETTIVPAGCQVRFCELRCSHELLLLSS